MEDMKSKLQSRGLTLAIGLALLGAASAQQTSDQAAHAAADAAWAAGNWDKAADAAELIGDYQMAARALMYQARCPSAKQPKGQTNDPVISRRAANLAQKALDTKQPGVPMYSLLTLNAGAAGVAASSESSMSKVIAVIQDSKQAYEAALKLNPSDPETVGSYAGFMGKLLPRGGPAFGINRSNATQAILKAQQLFNKLPEDNVQQRLDKGLLALNIAFGMSGTNNPQFKQYMDAGLKVLKPAEANNAEALCLANVIRVNQGMKVDRF